MSIQAIGKVPIAQQLADLRADHERLTRERAEALRMCKQAWRAARDCQDPASSSMLMRAEDALTKVETYLRDQGALDEEKG